ncbi:hypothetical protein NPIL_67161 [Nephila pilipes]|uniref:Uncharacterized protein n=1 Tax=Nephila pilipes TaxID=299642 RepID=A0A8X6T5W6_NEPPI|nr:hypothetical protein NPIL_67161 [Nephila pilipes]
MTHSISAMDMIYDNHQEMEHSSNSRLTTPTPPDETHCRRRREIENTIRINTQLKEGYRVQLFIMKLDPDYDSENAEFTQVNLHHQRRILKTTRG